MSVLLAYQADLLKELNEREQVSSDDIAKLRRTADLSLRATKETARAIGRSIYGGSGETSVADPVRYEGKRRRSSGSSLAALGLRGLLGGATLDEYRLFIQGGSKGERCLSCSPAAGPEAALLVWDFKVEAGSEVRTYG